MKKVVVSVFALGLLAACGNSDAIEAKSGEITSSVSSEVPIDEELLKEIEEAEKAEAERIEFEKRNQTTLKYDRLLHDFGTVAQGSENTTTFVVTNTGDKPLIISDVSASCGCTLPKKPEQPIAPGETDVIEVTFKPKPGQVNEIRKTVTVTANTDPKVSKVEIKAFVEE